MVREDDLRATFSALHAEDAPPRAVTAADVIRRGRTVRTRRRTLAVVGTGLATAAVVGVALAVLPHSEPPPGQLEPGLPVTTSEVPPTSPSTKEVELSPTTVPVTSEPPSPRHSTTIRSPGSAPNTTESRRGPATSTTPGSDE